MWSTLGVNICTPWVSRAPDHPSLFVSCFFSKVKKRKKKKEAKAWAGGRLWLGYICVTFRLGHMWSTRGSRISNPMALLDDEHELEGRLAICIRYAVGRGEEVARTLPDVRAVHLAQWLGVHQRFQLSPQRVGAEGGRPCAGRACPRTKSRATRPPTTPRSHTSTPSGREVQQSLGCTAGQCKPSRRLHLAAP
jgi:hypothetical protein